MVLGILSIKSISFLVFCVFAIAGLGYLLGRITIKGVSLGTAGVFIVALLFGALLYNPLAEHDYSVDKPSLREIKPGHFVNCNDMEYEKYMKELNNEQ